MDYVVKWFPIGPTQIFICNVERNILECYLGNIAKLFSADDLMLQKLVVAKEGGDVHLWLEHDLPGVISATGVVQPEAVCWFDLQNLENKSSYIIKCKVLVGVGFASCINGWDFGEVNF